VVRNLRRAGFAKGQSVLVIGAGPMGMLHVQLAKTMGAARVTVLEKNPVRRALAEALGADQVIDNAEDPAVLFATMPEGRAFDLTIDCVGRTALAELCFTLVRPGGTVSCFGLEAADRTAHMPQFDIVMHEKTVVGSVGADAEDTRMALDHLSNGTIDVAPYTECVFDLEEISEAFEALVNNQVALKAQVRVSREPR
jgi:threonine dehydrogenase-like Zn-dependent dehydrogenase